MGIWRFALLVWLSCSIFADAGCLTLRSATYSFSVKLRANLVKLCVRLIVLFLSERDSGHNPPSPDRHKQTDSIIVGCGLNVRPRQRVVRELPQADIADDDLARRFRDRGSASHSRPAWPAPHPNDMVHPRSYHRERPGAGARGGEGRTRDRQSRLDASHSRDAWPRGRGGSAIRRVRYAVSDSRGVSWSRRGSRSPRSDTRRPGLHCSGAKAVSFTQIMVTSVASDAAMT
jgi:hypothetical protein